MFLPGLVVGGWSSYLLLYVWSVPTSLQGGNEGVGWLAAPPGPVGNEPLVDSHHMAMDTGIRSERRHVLDYSIKSSCNISSHLVPGAGYLSTQRVRGGPYRLLVLIHSSPSALERRNAVRETWLKDQHMQGDYVGRFVIGLAGLPHLVLSHLACENMQYGDLLFLPSICDQGGSSGGEERDFSSSKKLLESFIWALANADFHYVLKSTDSTFAVLGGILKELKSKKTDYLWGFFAGGIQATRNGYLGEKNWTLCTHYLPYPEGGGYVISKQLLLLLDALREDLQHYTHDDIALGVWLSPFNGIERHHDVRFNTGHYSRGCNNIYLVTHKETAQSMHRKFSTLSRTGMLCEKEFSAKPSYHYNWTVPANKCCMRKTGVP
jgi:galactosylxylosylprotein 3-beta-galactosyltransferase